MKMQPIQVTPDYLEDLCEWMQYWSKQEDSYTVPQFLQWKGIGYHYMKYFCYQSEKVNNSFEVMKSVLHTRWLDLAMTKDEIHHHRAKVLMRYLRLYDSHGLDVEKSMKEALQDAAILADMKRTAENYATEELHEPYRAIYDQNDNKRRSREET